MLALLMDGYGSVEATRLGDVPRPAIGDDDVLVRNAGAGINPLECKEVGGILKAVYPQSGTWIVGGEGAGEIEMVGANVTHLAPGDRVLFLTDRGPGGGSLAEFTRVPASSVVPAPRTLELAQAAAIPTAGLTAYQGLFREDQGHLRLGQSVFVHGASGGVGSFAVSLGSASDLLVTASCRDENAAYVKELGAARVVDYRRDLKSQLVETESDLVDVVIDCYSGGHRHELLDLIRPGGRFVVVLTGHLEELEMLTSRAKAKDVSVTFMMIDAARRASDLVAIGELVDSRRMRMPQVTVFPLTEARDALIAMAQGGVRGKIVVKTS